MGDVEERGADRVSGCGPDAYRAVPPHGSGPWEGEDRAQAVREGAVAAPPPAPPVCDRCGARGDRRGTYYEAYVLLEPGVWAPAERVPPWRRWYVDAGGRAWNGGGGRPQPGTLCRIPHVLVCRAGGPPEVAGPGGGVVQGG
ncbi:DUF6083 domain-containing protein [Streptomyces kanasensis]|uniref:DUF6083 domain-containing protein n=1 Tax=Streptomyces kanasensis TaxID=936756 RepID=UPI0038065558